MQYTFITENVDEFLVYTIYIAFGLCRGYGLEVANDTLNWPGIRLPTRIWRILSLFHPTDPLHQT